MSHYPFKTVKKLAQECNCTWDGYRIVATETGKAEEALRGALKKLSDERALDSDSALVLFGSFARHEMLAGSDYDWALLIDGVVNIDHTTQVRKIDAAIKNHHLNSPATTGTFGNVVFSHELIHCIGGSADTNVNLTRRMLMLLESRCFNLARTDNSHVWRNVISNILKRYFEEDVHFSPQGKRTVPRFLLNDLTRYWRTICVDYAAKHLEQDGKKWALRNAKIRFSRKLLYATGLAFCLSCELDPPEASDTDLFRLHQDASAQPFIESALHFANTPPLEYLAAFVDAFVKDPAKRIRVSKNIFGSYNEWLLLLNNKDARTSLEQLRHDDAAGAKHFEKVRQYSSEFASGLRELFFNRADDSDPIANLSLEYVGF